MNKCPNCNNAISSIDVLCPKCGALVEQINTNTAPKTVVPEKTDEPGEESAPSAHDQYENLIVYNESYQMGEPPTPPKQPEVEEPMTQDDFEIDNIISSANSAPRVNPLFAHIEKHRHDEEEQAEPEPPQPETSSEDSMSEQAALDNEPQAVSAQDEPEVTTEDSDSNATAASPIAEEPITPDIITPDETAKSAPVQQEDLAYESADEAQPAATQEEINEVLQSELPDIPDNPPSGSLDAMPAYSQAYLDALKNIEMAEDELEVEENFDPDEFMAKFKKGASESDDSDATRVTDVKDADASPQNTLNQSPEVKPKKAEKEPRRRRYNPNKVRPVEEDEIEEPAVVPAAPVVPPVPVAQVPTAPVEAKKAKTSKSKKVVKEDTFHEQSKAKVADDELLELTLEPGKFYADEADADDAKEDEVFVFGQELEDPAADDDVKNIGPMNPYSAAVARPNTDVPRSASVIADPIPIKSGKLKRLPIWASILIWLGVTAGILFGFYMFDNYVSANYSGYGEYISEITDGKIDLDTLAN